MLQHLDHGNPSLQCGDGGEHEGSSAEVCACYDHHCEAEGEDLSVVSIYTHPFRRPSLQFLLTSAPIVLMSPGAFVVNHGAVFVLSKAAQANDKNMPAITDNVNTLSRRMLALVEPALPQSSTVSLGV